MTTAPASERGVHEIDEMADVRVLPAAPRLVHRVAESDTRVGVSEPERAAGPEMSERARVRAKPPLGHRELKAQAEARWALEHEIVAVHLLCARARDGLGGEHGDTVNRPVTGQRRVEARD